MFYIFFEMLSITAVFSQKPEPYRIHWFRKQSKWFIQKSDWIRSQLLLSQQITDSFRVWNYSCELVCQTWMVCWWIGLLLKWNRTYL